MAEKQSIKKGEFVQWFEAKYGRMGQSRLLQSRMKDVERLKKEVSKAKPPRGLDIGLDNISKKEKYKQLQIKLSMAQKYLGFEQELCGTEFVARAAWDAGRIQLVKTLMKAEKSND